MKGANLIKVAVSGEMWKYVALRGGGMRKS